MTNTLGSTPTQENKKDEKKLGLLNSLVYEYFGGIKFFLKSFL
jgi:hypothetical protein